MRMRLMHETASHARVTALVQTGIGLLNYSVLSFVHDPLGARELATKWSRATGQGGKAPDDKS
jgi:hypothetical protein